MASEQLANVKAEIKAWERAFRNEHGRVPSKDDMKAAAGMPERYRLYKELSNQTRPSSTRHAPDHPPSHSRNPFSPNKRAPPPAASASARAYLLLDDARVVPNPFSTPPRSRGRAGKSGKPKREREPSPDDDDDFAAAFPAIGTARPQDTPTTRARKRLRGEHVPPSPDKPSRARAFARVQSESVAAPKSAFFSSSKQPLDNDDDDDALGESPVKPADTNKNFRPIFDETPPDKPAAAAAPQRNALTRSKTLPVFARAPTKLSQRFGDGDSSDGDGDDDDATGPVAAPVFMSKAKPKANGVAPMPSPPSSSSVIEEPTKTSAPSRSSPDAPQPNGNSRKRALPDVDEGDEDADAGGQDAAGPSSIRPPANAKQAPIPIFSGLALLPPSPPAVKASWQPKGRKAAAGAGPGPRKTKKPRLEEQAEDEDESAGEEGEEEEVREVRWRSHGKLPLQPDADDGALDEDGVLAEWEREMRLMQQRAPLPREDELGEEETAQQVAVDVNADTLALLALDDAPDRHLHHTRRAERAIIRDLLLAPSGAARALGRAEEVWAPGEFDEEEGGSEPAAKGEDDDWDEEGMRWDEAEL